MPQVSYPTIWIVGSLQGFSLGSQQGFPKAAFLSGHTKGEILPASPASPC